MDLPCLPPHLMLNKLILHQTAGIALVLWANRFLEHLWFELIHNLFCAFCEARTEHLYIIQISCTLQVPPELSYKHCSGGYLLASHSGCPGLIPGQSIWDMRWTKYHWARCFSEHFSFQYHSTNASNSSCILV